MTLPEEPNSNHSVSFGGEWVRRSFQAPRQAAWVAPSFERLRGLPALPNLRELRVEADGSWSVEEWQVSGLLPFGQFLTNSAASIWVFVSIVQQCLAGLSALHARGFQHGAISPGTICCDPSGNVILLWCAGGATPPDWSQTHSPGTDAPHLRQVLALEDLRDLGRSFRAVLGGNPDVPMAVSRPDIAPLLAGWIDWIAEPAKGREPESIEQVEVIFGEIRTGRPGVRPWQIKAELPPELAGMESALQTELTGEDRAKLRRRELQAHGSGMEWRGLLGLVLIIVGIVAGGAWLVNYFLREKAGAEKPEQAVVPVPARDIPVVKIPEELLDMFTSSGGDIEPLPETGPAINQLMKLLEGELKAEPQWEEALKKQKELGRGELGGEPADGGRAETAYLPGVAVFPPLGKPSNGRGPGDFYLVWRTRQFVLTPQETGALQSAVLRAARYCGVRIMAWTVLPNQVGVVLRVLPARLVSDEMLERRIAILRDEKEAAGVTARINERLKAGDRAGADKIRLKWTAAMGSAVGFYTVVKSVPLVSKTVLQGGELWHPVPFRMSWLDPARLEIREAAAIVDTAAVKAGLVERAGAWPLCSLRAAMLNYGPALRAVSILMQRKPENTLPVPSREELSRGLHAYRRYLTDIPPETESNSENQPAALPLDPATPAAPSGAEAPAAAADSPGASAAPAPATVPAAPAAPASPAARNPDKPKP